MGWPRQNVQYTEFKEGRLRTSNLSQIIWAIPDISEKETIIRVCKITITPNDLKFLKMCDWRVWFSLSDRRLEVETFGSSGHLLGNVCTLYSWVGKSQYGLEENRGKSPSGSQCLTLSQQTFWFTSIVEPFCSLFLAKVARRNWNPAWAKVISFDI